MEGNGGSTDKRTLRVSGTLAIPRGWTVSVLIFTLKDKQWTANRQSAFSCHLLRSFLDDKCPEELAATAMAQVFSFLNETNGTYFDSNATDIVTLTSPMEDVDSQDETIATDDVTSMPYQLFVVILTLVQMMS